MSPAERRVFELIVRGKSNAQIARELGLTVKTVKFHLTNVFAKEGVTSRLELATKYRQKPDPAWANMMLEILK